MLSERRASKELLEYGSVISGEEDEETKGQNGLEHCWDHYSHWIIGVIIATLTVVVIVVLAVDSGGENREYSCDNFGSLTLEQQYDVYAWYLETFQPKNNVSFIEFKSNCQFIDDFNQKHDHLSLGLNQFSGFSNEEFKDLYSGLYIPENPNRTDPVENGSYPNSIDWSTSKYVTPVKNQMACASQWAFSSLAAIESKCSIVHVATATSLSAQELIDCTNTNSNCDAGAIDDGYAYAAENEGTCSESEYPYEGNDTYACRSSNCGHKYDPLATQPDTHYTLYDSEETLMSELQTNPVAVAVYGTSAEWQYYASGILHGACGTIDHALLLVGYGEESGIKYWRLKNSWGPDWGESGYVRICRDCGFEDGAFCINQYGTVPNCL